MITIFQNIKDTHSPRYITPEKIVERVKDSKHKELIGRIRNIHDKTERDVWKRSLPSICFSGRFEKRDNNSLLEYSGLICTDLDHVKNIYEIKKQICSDEYTYMCFISPSGDGLKVISKVPIDPDLQVNYADHEKYARGLWMYWNQFAPADFFKDIARVCYESYDPLIYFNPESEVWKGKEELPEQEIKLNPVGEVERDTVKIFNNLQKWIERKGEFYVDGNKHKFLVKLSAACSRFGLERDWVVDRLISVYKDQASPVPDRDFLDIVCRVYGKYSSTFNTAYFDKKEETPYNEANESWDVTVFDATLPAKDIIYIQTIKPSMLEGFEKGYQQGTTTGFTNLDFRWKWKKGEVTLFHGLPNHGKTRKVLNLMLIKSIRERTKWGVFSPEQNPPNDFYDDLIQAYVGKSTQPGNFQMSKEEYLRALDFIGEHFYYCYPEVEVPTPDYINARFEELILKHGIEGCLIDPFNQLDNDWEETMARDDKYISKFLSKEKRFALKHNVYKLIIAHPKSLSNNGKKDYDCPLWYDLAGGAMWANKCDNIIAIHRPYFNSDNENKIVEFRAQKIKKQKLVGRPGIEEMLFDWKTARYTVGGECAITNSLT